MGDTDLELLDEIVMELIALFDTTTEFLESLDDTAIMEFVALPIITKLSDVLSETNGELVDTEDGALLLELGLISHGCGALHGAN